MQFSCDLLLEIRSTGGADWVIKRSTRLGCFYVTAILSWGWVEVDIEAEVDLNLRMKWDWDEIE